MSIIDARTRAKQLNTQLTLKRQEERIKKIQEKEKLFQLHHDSMLPDKFVAEFEERFVRPRGILNEKARCNRMKRRFVLWRSVQKLITTIGVEPTDWFYHTPIERKNSL